MSLIRGSPFFGFRDRLLDDFNNFERQFNQLNPLFNGSGALTTTTNENEVPPIDFYDTEKDYVVHVSLPGVPPSNVTVDFDSNANELVVKGEIKPAQEELKKDSKVSERFQGTYERRLTLPSNVKVNDEAIEAKLNNGVLDVKLPKILDTERTTRRRIAITPSEDK